MKPRVQSTALSAVDRDIARLAGQQHAENLPRPDATNTHVDVGGRLPEADMVNLTLERRQLAADIRTLTQPGARSPSK
jgi:hypothetical protein